MLYTLEALCWLWLGCWANNAANNPSPGTFNSQVLYYTPVWCCSACTCLIDPAINNALRTVSGCLRPTPADNLPILAGIQPVELCRKGATLSLARRAVEPGYLLHSALTCPLSGNARHLKSRHPFVPAPQQLISSSDDKSRSAVLWTDHRWNAESWRTLQDSSLSSLSPAPTLLDDEAACAVDIPI